MPALSRGQTTKSTLPHHNIRLKEDVIEDMNMWLQFLQYINGKTISQRQNGLATTYTSFTQTVAV